MDLVPLETEEQDDDASASQASNQGAAVRTDPTVVQNMNVTTAAVERRDLSQSILTVGYLDYDQAMSAMDEAGLFYAEPLQVGRYEEALAFPIGFESTIPRRRR